MRVLIVATLVMLAACSGSTQSDYDLPEEDMTAGPLSYNDDPFLSPAPDASDRCPEAMPTGGPQPNLHEGTWNLFCEY
jgi:hypothetical protein